MKLDRSGFTLLFVLLSTCAPLTTAHALKCREQTFDERVRAASHVFVGEIKRVEGTGPIGKRVTVAVLKELKTSPGKPLSRTFVVVTEKWHNYFTPQVGALYLFFGTSWLCTHPIRLR